MEQAHASGLLPSWSERLEVKHTFGVGDARVLSAVGGDEEMT
jgi:hypothetical protein